MRLRPTRLAVGLPIGALTLFGVGTNVQAGWVLAIAAILLGVFAIGLLLPVRALRGLGVQRTTPSHARAGDRIPVTLVVSNGSRGVRGPVLVQDSFCGTGAAVAGVLGPGANRAFAADRGGARRGVHTSGVSQLSSGAPFGVAVASRTVDVPGQIVVYPRTFDLSLSAVLGRAAMPNRSASGDITSVREYKQGDPLRHVHWRSTARRGELVVKEFEDRARSDLLVVADAPLDPDVLDAVASVACSFALAGLRDGREVEILSAQHGRQTRTPCHTEQVVLEWGARLEPSTPRAGSMLADVDGGAIVCVLGADVGVGVGRLRQLANEGSDVVAVLVEDRSSDDPPAPRVRATADALRDAGLAVRVVPSRGEVSSSFRAPSAVS